MAENPYNSPETAELDPGERFSMRRMLVAIAIWSIAAFCFMASAETYHERGFRISLLLISGAAAGAGVGVLDKHPIIFGFLGAFLGAALTLVAFGCGVFAFIGLWGGE